MSLVHVRRPLAAALGVAAALFTRVPAFAQGFIPPPIPRYGELRAHEATPAATPMPQLRPLEGFEEHREVQSPVPTKTPARILGVSFNFVERSEDLNVKIINPQSGTLGPFKGTSDVSVYAARLDGYVYGCAFAKSVHCPLDEGDKEQQGASKLLVNVGAMVGYADGSSSVLGARTDLHGPVLGASTVLTLIGKVEPIDVPSWVAFAAPFLMVGFDYAATDYSAIKGWLHAYGVGPRAGLMALDSKDRTLFIYGGAAWEDFTENQTTTKGVKTRVNPREHTTGLLGAALTNLEGPLENVSLTVEGEVGDRTGVLLSLRYGLPVPHWSR